MSRTMRFGVMGGEDDGSNGMVWESTSLLPTTTRRRDDYDASIRGVGGDEEAMPGRRRLKHVVLVAVAVVVASMIIMAAPAGKNSSNISSKSRTFVEPVASLQQSSLIEPNVLDASILATASVDSLIDRWDDFKEAFSRKVHAVAASATSAADDEHVLEFEHDVAQLPTNVKEEGRKFAALVRQWWDQDEAAVQEGAAATGQTAKQWWNSSTQWTAQEVGAAEQAVGSWWNTAEDATATELGTWWNATEHATERDADAAEQAVGTWWNATEHAAQDKAADMRDNMRDNMRDKEQAVQRNFVAWWKTASADERAWWNHTVQQAQEMEQNAADKEHVWWDETVGDYWNRTEHAVADDWDRSKHAVADDWDETEHAVADKWDQTKHATTDKWDATEHAVADKWDNTEHAVADDWNKTKHAVADDWDKTEHALDWNATKDREALWWNATERWFHYHLREVDPDADDEMRQPLLYLNSSTAYSLLMNGYGWYDYSADFFAMQSGFDAQINQAYCGVASSAAILNSLRSSAANLTLPVDPRYKPYQYATQTNLLDHKCSRRHVIRHNATFDGVIHTPSGVSMLQIKALLQCYLPADSWQVIATQVDPAVISRDRFRQDITSALRNKHARVMVNFNRAVLGQHGGGHFSPIASYSKEQDAFLIMDVAKYKYPPVWVSVGRLHASAGTTDGCGDWDFPAGQDRLSRKDLLGSNSARVDYDEGLRELNCTTTFRGYIIVQPS